MTRLADLVAAIMHDMTAARIQSAAFVAQMAADFRGHELLGRMPIPDYRVSAAELSIPFAIAEIGPERRTVADLGMDRGELAEMVRRITVTLTGQRDVKEAFSVYDQQVNHWRDEIAPAIGERMADEAGEADSVEGFSAVYGHLAKSRYVLDLVEEQRRVSRARLNESVSAGHPDLIEQAARRLLTRELDRALGEPVESGLHIHVVADEVEEARPVSTLRLEIADGVLEGVVFSDAEEGDVE